MTSFDEHRCWGAAAVACLLAAVLVATAVASAVAEDNAANGAGPARQAQEDATSPAAASLPAQPPPVQKHGFLNDLGHWWNQSFADFNAKMKAAREKLEDFNKKQNDTAKDAATSTQQALKNAAQATKDAATAVARLPSTRVLELRDRCAPAANGAPDCQTAATNACRKHGFNSGQPMDVRTSQECPAAVLLSGRMPAAGECPEETVILRAVCQ